MKLISDQSTSFFPVKKLNNNDNKNMIILFDLEGRGRRMLNTLAGSYV